MYLLLFLISIIIITIIAIITIILLINYLKPIEFTDINTDCKYRRWGCCNDNITPKYDFNGSNCRGF